MSTTNNRNYYNKEQYTSNTQYYYILLKSAKSAFSSTIAAFHLPNVKYQIPQLSLTYTHTHRSY